MEWEGFQNHYHLLLMVSPNGVVVTKWYLLMGPKFGYHYHTIPLNTIKYHYLYHPISIPRTALQNTSPATLCQVRQQIYRGETLRNAVVFELFHKDRNTSQDPIKQVDELLV